MLHLPDNRLVARNWESFILLNKDNALYTNNVRKEILESWTRCKKHGTDPNITLLPPRDIALAEKIYAEVHSFHRDFVVHHLEKFYSFLEENESVVLYTDNRPIISIQRGSKQLLDWLNSKNIGLGTKIDENVIGTNAASLALKSQAVAYVFGAEHYISLFHNLACIAIPFSIRSSNYKGLIIFITQIRNFNPFQISMLDSFVQLLSSTVDLEMKNRELLLAYDYMNLSLDQGDKGIAFINNLGNIHKVNKRMLEIFNIQEKSVINNKFSEVFPELIPVMEYMKTGHKAYLQEIHLQRQGQKRTYFMDCHPTHKGNHCVGMTITLHNKKYIHKNVTQVANYRAHFEFNDLIGSSPNFIAVKKAARNAARSPSSVLIIGESGTGKELFAQAIHNASNRANGPFISINCAAIPRELIGSELFGYMEGAFTGARKGGAPGKFELADKGTIFLDEIGEMPHDMQAVLLRVLEEKIVTRLGDYNPVPIDVKVIAATNKDLGELINAKLFRLDLYYRLNVIKLQIPALRDRRDDIPLLAEHFFQQFNDILQGDVIGIATEVSELFKCYHWPGNIRELRNVIERGINQCSSSYLKVTDLPEEILKASFCSPTKPANFERALVEKFSQKVNENRQISNLMQKFNGNKARVAKELGITRATLYRKLKTIGYDDNSITTIN